MLVWKTLEDVEPLFSFQTITHLITEFHSQSHSSTNLTANTNQFYYQGAEVSTAGAGWNEPVCDA